MANVLVIGAHPDDELLGVGGTLLRHRQRGDQVFVHLLTDGHTSRYRDADRAGEVNPEVEARHASAERAASLLGFARVKFSSFFDQRLDAVSVTDVVQEIEDFARQVEPDIVYTHHRGDVNSDHRVVFAASLTAFRSVGPRFPRRVLCYETISSTEWGAPFPEYAFTPNVFVDISAVLEAKMEALMAYSQELRPFPHPRSIEGLRAAAQRWGMTVGVAAAEPFVLVREVW